MIKDNSHFTKMVDALVAIADYDDELKDGIKWLDNNNKVPGNTFYEKVFEVLYKYEINQKAKKWRESNLSQDKWGLN